jgi:hypothetical protein
MNFSMLIQNKNQNRKFAIGELFKNIISLSGSIRATDHCCFRV